MIHIELNSVDVLLFSFSFVLIVAVLVSIWVSGSRIMSTFMTEVFLLQISYQSGSVLILSVLFGFGIKLFAMATHTDKFNISTDVFSQIFYQAFLPLIIFNAGFTMKKV